MNILSKFALHDLTSYISVYVNVSKLLLEILLLLYCYQLRCWEYCTNSLDKKLGNYRVYNKLPCTWQNFWKLLWYMYPARSRQHTIDTIYWLLLMKRFYDLIAMDTLQSSLLSSQSTLEICGNSFSPLERFKKANSPLISPYRPTQTLF